VQLCLITQFRMGHSADYPQCVAISRVVTCGKGVVTWFSASTNHMHSARAFHILRSAFRILPEPTVLSVLTTGNSKNGCKLGKFLSAGVEYIRIINEHDDDDDVKYMIHKR